MRALSFLAPKGLRQKRILLGSECAPHGGVGLGSGAPQATHSAVQKEATGLLFHALHCFKLNEDAL